MDYNKLRTFVEVARLGSVTKAAEKLYRTQSAITQQIQQLEKDTSLFLFERRRSRVFLSKEGQRLFEFATLRLQEIDDEIAAINGDRRLVEGVIRIGILPEFSSSYLPLVLKKFNSLYPKVKFELYLGGDQQIEERLLNNEVDFGFVVSLIQPDFFETDDVLEKELSLVASVNYLKTKQEITDWEDLLGLDYIEFGDNFLSLRTWLKHNQCKTLGPNLDRKKPLLVVKDDMVIKQMIVQGLGVGILPRYLIDKELENGSLKLLLQQQSEPVKIKVQIARRKRRNSNLAEERFAEFIRQN